MIVTENNVNRYNELPIPKTGAEFPPEWSDAQRMQLQFQLENFNTTIKSLSNSLATTASLTSGDFDFSITEKILEIANSVKLHTVTIKDEKASFTDARVLKQKIADLLEKFKAEEKKENEREDLFDYS